MKKNLRIFDLLESYQEKFQPKEDVLAGKLNGEWQKYNIEQFIHSARCVALHLINSGIKPQDKVASIMQNSPEWNFIDMGIMLAGGVHVPIYPTASDHDFEYILKHAKAQLLFISGGEIETRIQNIQANLPDLKETFAVRPQNGTKDFTSIFCKNISPNQLAELKKIGQGIHHDDVASLIYTSGTTGVPKGVMLSHKNLMSNVQAVSYIPTFGEEGKALSFLPLCHVYERILVYLYLYLGISIYYAESLGTITNNIQEIKPDMMSAVPRFLEKIFEKILKKGRELKGIKKYFFDLSLDIAKDYSFAKEKGIGWYQFKLMLARKLVFNKWRDALGGNFKIIVSGGAALRPELAQIFWAAKLPVFEGYGLSETSPIIAVTNNDKGGLSFGTVGPVIKDVEVKFSEEGEILCKGPNVMKGYYKDPEKTKEAIDPDGWFHTGDIGLFNDKKHLKITGRKKEIFKTSGGKYIAPAAIENKLKASLFIENAMVVGENQKFASAIIVPDFPFLKKWCKENFIPFTNESDIIQNKEVRYRVLAEVQKTNQSLGKAEKINKFRFCQNVWSVESREITPTMKLRRNIVLENYKHLIEDIYK